MLVRTSWKVYQTISGICVVCQNLMCLIVSWQDYPRVCQTALLSLSYGCPTIGLFYIPSNSSIRWSVSRLSKLPARIGNLKELKELHLRKNLLKYFPFSISKLEIYTINCEALNIITRFNVSFSHVALYNPLLEDTDIEMISNLIKSPKEPVPTLVELAARIVVKRNIQRKPGDLPRCLEGNSNIY